MDEQGEAVDVGDDTDPPPAAATGAVPGQPTVTVDFCGEIYAVAAGEPLVIGREGELEIDDNPYLHRRFLQIGDHDGLWWLTNIGTTLTATVGDEQGSMQAWLAPILAALGNTIVDEPPITVVNGADRIPLDGALDDELEALVQARMAALRDALT